MDKQKLLLKRLRGSSYTEIAKEVGLSRQRIQQILSPPKEIRAYVLAKYKLKCANCETLVGKSGHVHHKELNGENYHDIDNLELLCISCHQRVHNIESEIIYVSCSWCGIDFTRRPISILKSEIERSRSGLLFCSKRCQGLWFTNNHGAKKGNKRRLGHFKHDYKRICELNTNGLSGIKIARQLDIPESTVYKILSSRNK